MRATKIGLTAAFTLCLFAVLLGAYAMDTSIADDGDGEGHDSGEAAIEKLKEGNARYAEWRLAHPHLDEERRSSLANGQHPFATVLTCADSRVSPELVFDQGLGDLFVIRVAGNVLDDSVVGSLEYAAHHLHCPLIVVLGHERCGAVTAALQGGEFEGGIAAIVDAIQPACEVARGQGGDTLDNAVRANVHLVVGQVRSSQPTIAEIWESGKLLVVGARYDLDTGEVEFFPWPKPH